MCQRKVVFKRKDALYTWGNMLNFSVCHFGDMWQPNLSNKALMAMSDTMDVYMTVSQQPSQIVVFVL